MLEVTLLGVRGSTPAPGPDHVLVGGHTSCVAVSRPDGRYLVLDAGTGLRNLGGLLDGAPLRGSIALTHLHWDHVQGLPFLPNADRPDAEVALHLPSQPPGDATRLLSRIMGPPFFPVDPTALRGRWTRSMLDPGVHQMEGLEVTASAVHHKGGTTYGYRVSDGRHALAYLPDHAPGTADEAHLRRALALAEDVDLLLHGGQFTDEQRTMADAFGHATISDATALADAAGARRLVLVHHAPARTDAEVVAVVPSQTPGGCPIQIGRELDRLLVGAGDVPAHPGTPADRHGSGRG